MKNIREQLDEVLYQESARGYIKDTGNFLMRGAGFLNPVVSTINKARDYINKPKPKVPKTTTKAPGTTKPETEFGVSHAIGGAMVAGALGLGAKALYDRYKKKKEKKRRSY